MPSSLPPDFCLLALVQTVDVRACLHAKCVVVDDERLLITSANFTEAAHERNIEVGVLLADPVAARTMKKQFENLAEKGIFQKVITHIPHDKI